MLLILSWILFWMSLGGYNFWYLSYDMIRYLDIALNESELLNAYINSNIYTINTWDEFLIDYYNIPIHNNIIDYDIVLKSYEKILVDEKYEYIDTWIVEHFRLNNPDSEKLDEKILIELFERQQQKIWIK